MLLGDACLIKRPDCVGATFSFVHSLKQMDYALWKANLINQIFKDKGLPRRCRTYQRAMPVDKRTGKVYHNLTVYLLWSKYLTILRTRTHKVIQFKEMKDAEYLLKQLDSDLHLAIWFGDDGAELRQKNPAKTKLGNPSYDLCTDSFTLGQQHLIQQWFKLRYDVLPSVIKHSGNHRLHFSVEDSRKIFPVIAPYLMQTDSMKQKFWLSFERYYNPKSTSPEIGDEDIIQVPEQNQVLN